MPKKREDRSKNAIAEIQRWYEISGQYHDEMGQRALSAVLWLLMDKAAYELWREQEEQEEGNPDQLSLEDWYIKLNK